MATSVRKLEIRVDQTGNAEKGIGRLTDLFSSIPAPVGLAAGAIAAVGTATIGVGSKLIGLGSDAEEMSSKFNVVFGTSAPEAIAALDEFGNTVGRSKFELMEMAATVQDTFVPLGFARDEASGMSTELTKLAVDMGSFNNVADDQVMLDLQSAIVGNHETMRKYGVVITQATLDQELLKMGVEGGIAAATEQEKVQARLNLIYAGTSDAQGDATATAGSWANQMRALKSTLSEAATTIGSELLPFVTPLLGIIVDLATTALPPLLEGFKEVMGHLKDELGPVIDDLFQALGEIAEALGLNTGEMDLLTLAVEAMKIGISLAATVLQGIAEVVQDVADALGTLRDAIDWVIDKWNEMKQAAQDAINAIPDWLTPGSPTPLEIGLRGIGDAMGDVNKKLGSGFKGFGSLASGAATGSATGHTYVIQYSPVLSLADEYELEQALTPIIRKAMRSG